MDSSDILNRGNQVIDAQVKALALMVIVKDRLSILLADEKWKFTFTLFEHFLTSLNNSCDPIMIYALDFSPKNERVEEEISLVKGPRNYMLEYIVAERNRNNNNPGTHIGTGFVNDLQGKFDLVLNYVNGLSEADYKGYNGDYVDHIKGILGNGSK